MRERRILNDTLSRGAAPGAWLSQQGVWVRLLLALALLSVVLPSTNVFSQVGPGASLTVVRGSVSVTRPDGTAIYPAGTGLTLALGDVVGTLERTRAIVTFFSGSEVELGSNTTIVIRRLDRDLLDSANVTVEHLTGMSVIRINNGQPVRVLSDDTVAVVYRGEAGHGVDPTTNNITVACVDGGSKCSPSGVAFPAETAFLPGAVARVITGRGDRIDFRGAPGSSVWDILAEGGGLGQSEGTSTTRIKSGRNQGDDDEAQKPQGTPTPTSAPATPTPPAGTPGPACNTAVATGGTNLTTVHNLGRSSGTLHIDWDSFPAADQYQIFYEGVEILNTGLVSNSGSANVPFAGTSTFIQVTVTTGPGSNQWTYTIACLP
ncbi:MAG: hypothetical protein IT306_17970 [Chloroflexi bacterium]|nr:hypothetical protein [Chloroflexota bacterium]